MCLTQLSSLHQTRHEAMQKRLPRQSAPRTVVSLHMPHSEWVRNSRAAGMANECLSEFLREAARRRCAELLTDDPPLSAAA